MARNVGAADRAVRMIVGIMMMALGLSGAVAGAPGTILGAFGALLLATGTAGRCLLYRAFGWNTVHDGV